jgi:hypothetical protein
MTPVGVTTDAPSAVTTPRGIDTTPAAEERSGSDGRIARIPTTAEAIIVAETITSAPAATGTSSGIARQALTVAAPASADTTDTNRIAETPLTSSSRQMIAAAGQNASSGHVSSVGERFDAYIAPLALAALSAWLALLLGRQLSSKRELCFVLVPPPR